MPLNPRIRDNNVFGTVDDNPLTTNSTAMNSAGLANLSTVATKHAVLTLDPLRQYGPPEIVIVTTHTASAPIITMTRGAYGTVSREHPQGTLWVHAPINADFIAIATSIARPLDPYDGQFIYESDTKKLVGFGGTDWAPRDAGGQLGYSQSVVSASATAGTTELVLFTVTATVGTGRRIRVTLFEPNSLGTVAADFFEFRIKEDANYKQATIFQVIAGNVQTRTSVTSIVLTPTAGIHTYTGTLVRTSGTGTLTATRSASNVGYMLVEDIGAA